MLWLWIYALLCRGACFHTPTYPSVHPVQSIAASSHHQRHCSLLQVGKNSTAEIKKTKAGKNSTTGGVSECNLQFLHIPKTAGSSIEEWGKTAGLKWGAKFFGLVDVVNISGSLCPLFHVPPSIVTLLLANKTLTAVQNPYLDSEVFCVKRDPYARAVSEYSWRLDRFLNLSTEQFATTLNQVDEDVIQICPGCDYHETCSASGMNYFLTSILLKIKNRSESPSVDRCHFLPQVDYIWSKGERTCKHVLDLENLTDEFEQLMAREHCDLPKSYQDEVSTQKTSICENLSPTDLEPETRALIQDVYKDDFEKLGFPM